MSCLSYFYQNFSKQTENGFQVSNPTEDALGYLTVHLRYPLVTVLILSHHISQRSKRMISRSKTKSSTVEIINTPKLARRWPKVMLKMACQCWYVVSRWRRSAGLTCTPTWFIWIFHHTNQWSKRELLYDIRQVQNFFSVHWNTGVSNTNWVDNYDDIYSWLYRDGISNIFSVPVLKQIVYHITYDSDDLY